MAILEILKYPDPRLRKKCAPVKEVTAELKQLAQDMLETMYHARGIGLAAAQVNKQIRLVVIDIRPKEEGRYKVDQLTEWEKQTPMPLIVFNPEVVKRDGKTTYDEGCLSVPTYFETVERAKNIELKGMDLTGKEFVLPMDGLLAICVQHEIDHLDGKLFIDRLSMIKSNLIKAKIKKFGYPDPEDQNSASEQSDEDEEVSL
ncbi:MAG: peptide deformylase [Bdellovibrionales bacterium]|nr:peptide deformylase [Bdellovibrionales bacterium]